MNLIDNKQGDIADPACAVAEEGVHLLARSNNNIIPSQLIIAPVKIPGCNTDTDTLVAELIVFFACECF